MKHKAIFSLKYKRKNKINEVSSSEIFIWRFKVVISGKYKNLNKITKI